MIIPLSSLVGWNPHRLQQYYSAISSIQQPRIKIPRFQKSTPKQNSKISASVEKSIFKIPQQTQEISNLPKAMAVGKSTSSIALIISSVRPGRNGPKVAKLVAETIQKNLPKNVALKVVDLAEWNLPVFEQTEIPFSIQKSELYSTEIAKRWSKEISSHDGYIFLVPGTLKNAFDYLYNEWSGKPAMIVNYGGRPVDGLNGGKHFTDILNSLQMKLPTILPKVSIATLDREKTAVGKDLVFYEPAVENQVRSDIAMAWEGILKSLKPSGASPASA
ncbi:hypothetical protein Dda_5684 [Drechslerella dactyloides]|uniref:NADPH-dependent FMN reductase-like domain-containing protein n=1 Tax=Drechslerella dactyloides TaxID=74499 RepID=A0AAD6IWP1_DREDA|nr:hypothetical protein Dda_5684 [Drechslerella dactyloides]